jgi:hypothetical protein
MNARRAAAIATTAVLSVGAGNAIACMGSPMPEKLPATPALESTLESTYRASHHGAGPVNATRTHLGTVMGDWYAVATFVVNGHAGKPTIFVRHHHSGPWHISRQTRGAVCGRYIPTGLIKLWKLDRVHHTNCFVEPGTKV